MVYQIIIDGKKYGQYKNINCPKNTAKKMCKMIYLMNKYDGAKEIIINFVRNRVNDLGGDISYTYKTYIEPLEEPDPQFGLTKEKLLELLNEGKEQELKKMSAKLKKYIENHYTKIKDKYIMKKYMIDAKRI